MNEDDCIRDNSAPWETVSIENVDQNSRMELYILEHHLEICSIPKDAIKDFAYILIKTAFLPDSRFVAIPQFTFSIGRDSERGQGAGADCPRPQT